MDSLPRRQIRHSDVIKSTYWGAPDLLVWHKDRPNEPGFALAIGNYKSNTRVYAKFPGRNGGYYKIENLLVVDLDNVPI